MIINTIQNGKIQSLFSFGAFGNISKNEDSGMDTNQDRGVLPVGAACGFY